MEADPASLLLLGLSLTVIAFAAAAETAFATINRNNIRQLCQSGNARACTTEELLRKPPQMLFAMLLLKSSGLVGMGGATIRLLNGAVSLLQTILLIGLVCLLVTCVQVFSRASVLNRAQAVALYIAPIVQTLTKLFLPVTVLLRFAAGYLDDEQTAKAKETILLTEDGLRLLMNVGEEDTILESEKEMIASILEMDETVVREVMVPRIDMVALDVDTTFRSALDVIISAGHSRIPIYEEHADRVIGILYARDMLRCFQQNSSDVSIQELLRPAYFIPASKKINDLIAEMQTQRVHIAMVVDEYGGTAGLVTIEDLLEEIVGEIQDEYDEEADVYVESIDSNIYLLNSRVDIYSLAELLDIEPPEELADTLGGMIYGLLGHVPEQGEAVEYGGWRFTVLSLDGRRIDQVRAELLPPPAGEADETPSGDSESSTGQTAMNPKPDESKNFLSLSNFSYFKRESESPRIP